MSSAIRLIATDLDGTLAGSGSDFMLYPELASRLQTYRERFGAEWVVCTGRSLNGFESAMQPLMAVGIAPKYVVVHHAYIYRLGKRGYWPHIFWNLGIRFHVWSSTLYLRGALNEWLRIVRAMTGGVTTIHHRRNRLCLRFRTEAEAESAAALLRNKANLFKNLRVFHYLLEVDVRTVPFTKGMALSELATRLNILGSEILAIGNGHNDISMLDGTVAGRTGCPVNAEVDVMEVVHKGGGHIATQRGLEGVVEIMDAWLNGTVNSTLPDGWVPNHQQKNPKTVGRRMNHPARHSGPQSSRIGIRLGFLAGYTVLVVFASVGAIPFSGVIMKPFTLVAQLVEKILQTLGV